MKWSDVFILILLLAIIAVLGYAIFETGRTSTLQDVCQLAGYDGYNAVLDVCWSEDEAGNATTVPFSAVIVTRGTD